MRGGARNSEHVFGAQLLGRCLLTCGFEICIKLVESIVQRYEFSEFNENTNSCCFHHVITFLLQKDPNNKNPRSGRCWLFIRKLLPYYNNKHTHSHTTGYSIAKHIPETGDLIADSRNVHTKKQKKLHVV